LQAEGAPTNTTGVPNGDGESSPTPPPHRSSPPRSQSSDAGESFKLTGNKFYKAGDYERAIQEYNKGQWSRVTATVTELRDPISMTRH
jgi:DnaJ family protein C protein 7